jgi:CheY-like chemotaxis protein
LPGKKYTALNGAEAVDICRLTHNVDLVLMDIKMPVMDGYTFGLKNTPKPNLFPLILLFHIILNYFSYCTFS